jgi:hypothetical protein
MEIQALLVDLYRLDMSWMVVSYTHVCKFRFWESDIVSIQPAKTRATLWARL